MDRECSEKVLPVDPKRWESLPREAKSQQIRELILSACWEALPYDAKQRWLDQLLAFHEHYDVPER